MAMRGSRRQQMKNPHAEADQFQRRAAVGFLGIAIAMIVASSNPGPGTTCSTFGWPMVSVPVLSKMMTSSFTASFSVVRRTAPRR